MPETAKEIVMTGLYSLWLPILLSSILVFVASSLIHMVSPWHKSDYPAVPNQDAVMNALRPFAIPPGDYMMPRPTTREEMRSPEFIEKVRKGPNMILTVRAPGPMAMGQTLIIWFLYLIVVSILVAYVAGRALPPGAPFRAVFRIAGMTAFMGYAVALWQTSIWFWRSWSITAKTAVDGLIFALLTAAAFGWLWPR
jgi:hypothetical protein